MPPKVRLTNPDRLYWPDAGLTKQGLADYYAAVWPRIAPHVTLRPLALLRCPGGTAEACYFQKHPWKGHGPQILTPPDPLNPDDPPLIAVEDAGLVRWIRSAARRSRRVTSVCSGSFLLARAGLLEGRRATTHWSSCAELARRHPEVEVDPNPIFVHDGDVWTSAGVTSGMDLALALVEEDLGRDLALAVARRLVLFVKRPGGQSQFSAQLAGQLAERAPLRELQAWIAEHPEADCSVVELARREAMAAKGAPSLTATVRNPGGSATTRSPWLIHTCSRAPFGHNPSNSAQPATTSMKARPNSRWSDGSTLPPSWAHIVCSP